MPDLSEDLENYDQIFAKWQKNVPDGTFSQFSVQRIAASIEKGRPHTTLGPRLNQGKTWWKDGEEHCQRLLEYVQYIKSWPSIPTDLKFCDYGCGSLRVSAHLIKRQEAGCVAGLDVTEDFIQHGRNLMGSLVDEKQPLTGTIDDAIDDVVAMDVDVLFSYNVSSHVHPNETEKYYGNLKRIAHKEGALAQVHVLVVPEHTRFQRSGWAWPREFYIESMKPMTLVDEAIGDEFERHGNMLSLRVMTFERKSQ